MSDSIGIKHVRLLSGAVVDVTEAVTNTRCPACGYPVRRGQRKTADRRHACTPCAVEPEA